MRISYLNVIAAFICGFVAGPMAWVCFSRAMIRRQIRDHGRAYVLRQHENHISAIIEEIENE